MGGFSFFVFLNPWALIVKFLIVFYLGKGFLFKSSLAGCECVLLQLYLPLHTRIFHILQKALSFLLTVRQTFLKIGARMKEIKEMLPALKGITH